MRELGVTELEKILCIMQKMHLAVDESDWQRLTMLDNERRHVLDFEASDPGVTSGATLIRYAKQASASESKRDTLISEIHELDCLIIDAVQLKRQELLNENRELSAQQKAKNLYAMTSSMT